MLSLIFFSVLVLGTYCSSATLPEWKDLNCPGQVSILRLSIVLKFYLDFQPGHKYLFSEITHNWEDARGECELYGGWLVRIFDLEEYNCIMRHAVKEEAGIWYWTDGNDVANTGVWVHAFDNSEVSFFPHTINCCSQDHLCHIGGEAFALNTGGSRKDRGNY